MNKRNIFLLKQYLNEIYFKNNKKSGILIVLLSALRIGVVLIPPIYIMKIMDHAIPEKSFFKIGLYIIIVLIFTILDALSSIKLAELYGKLSKKVYMLYQKKCINHMFNLSGKYFSERSIGDGFTTIMSDVAQIQGLTSSMIFGFISDTITAITMLFFLYFIQRDMILLVICLLPLIYFSQYYFQKKGGEKAKEVRTVQGKLTGVLENIVSNSLLCILCNSTNYILQKYNSIVEESTDEEVDIKMIYAKNSGILTFLATFFTIFILGFGGMKVMQGSLTIGGLIAFNMYAQKLVVPLLKISNVLMALQSMFASMERIDDFLHEPEVKVKKQALKQGIKQKDNIICYQDITFNYEENLSILNNISFTFNSSVLNVVVGESGCGKSTLISLLYRIWDAETGSIIINDFNNKDYDMKYLRSRISIVSQDSYIFDDTILNNIVIDGNPNLDFVYKCTKIACIHDYIMTLPEKYESIVGDKGVKLSGGEKQRICIARALVRNAPIIILDEATSALDQLTEKQIIDNIIKEMSGRTIIMITHRLHSIMDADVIYVLKEGKVEDQGKHSELINRSMYYKRLFERDLESLQLEVV